MLNSYIIEFVATEKNFNEEGYLLSNPDVAKAVNEGRLRSGRKHFDLFGRKEGRKIRLPSSLISESKKKKLERIRPLLRKDISYIEKNNCYDFLSEELRSKFNIIETDAISGCGYDAYGIEIIEKNAEGLVLDCGAGRRPVYFDNVVNFEIVDFDTTDVRGVGEDLPFVDQAFDAVLSIAVLEHVKDPFLCAKEISRVIKPGGDLMCCVPFLQPFHAHPHHYYNMTSQGIQNLFSDYLCVDKVTVYGSVLPISSLTWILRSWADGLQGKTKKDFMNLRVSDLIGDIGNYLDKPFVKELSMEKNLELASATVLFAHKE
ncbi:MAG: methyltransferase domain-containing protein [Candidatus Competibacter denitrificans]